MRKKIVLVLIVAAAAFGTALATTAIKPPKPCPPGQKPLFCADGRIVCCAPHDACDCGG